MKIFPAIDLFDGKAVRLRKGDYNEMTVYSENPVEIAIDFKNKGTKFIHIVDLEGAKDGYTKNLDSLSKILSVPGLFCEVGGGIRNLQTIEKILSMGASRVILGTAAVENVNFLKEAINQFDNHIAVGADIKKGFIAIKGWLSESNISLNEFAKKMQDLGVKTMICTDISRDGELKGANIELYKMLKNDFSMEIIASGGVTTLNEIKTLKEAGVDGAIIGKAYYENKISLEDAIKLSE